MFDVKAASRIMKVVRKLNKTPRKCLGFKTLAEVFYKHFQPLRFKCEFTTSMKGRLFSLFGINLGIHHLDYHQQSIRSGLTNHGDFDTQLQIPLRLNKGHPRSRIHSLDYHHQVSRS